MSATAASGPGAKGKDPKILLDDLTRRGGREVLFKKKKKKEIIIKNENAYYPSACYCYHSKKQCHTREKKGFYLQDLFILIKRTDGKEKSCVFDEKCSLKNASYILGLYFIVENRMHTLKRDIFVPHF